MRRATATMRRTKFGILATSALFVCGCGGSGGAFANKPRPPAPVNMTVYIDNARVSVSPGSVGAGPVSFIVTNQANQTESMNVQSAGGGQLATTGPINPQSTAQVTVDLRDPGDYNVTATSSGGSQAQQAGPGGVQPATIHIGAPRPSSSGQLLQP